MITFSGDVSDNARLFMKKLEARLLIIITSIVFIVFSIPIILIGILMIGLWQCFLSRCRCLFYVEFYIELSRSI